MHLWPRCIEKKTEKNTFYLKSKKKHHTKANRIASYDSLDKTNTKRMKLRKQKVSNTLI